MPQQAKVKAVLQIFYFLSLSLFLNHSHPEERIATSYKYFTEIKQATDESSENNCTYKIQEYPVIKMNKSLATTSALTRYILHA